MRLILYSSPHTEYERTRMWSFSSPSSITNMSFFFFPLCVRNCISYKLHCTGALWSKHPNSWSIRLPRTMRDSSPAGAVRGRLAPMCGPAWVGGQGGWEATCLVMKLFVPIPRYWSVKAAWLARSWWPGHKLNRSPFCPAPRKTSLWAHVVVRVRGLM